MTTMTLTSVDPTESAALDDRREARVERQRTVRMFEPFTGRFFAAETCNVSGGGMCLLMHADIGLRAGRFVTLHCTPDRLDDAASRTITARVVWVRGDGVDADTLRVGLQLYAVPLAVAA